MLICVAGKNNIAVDISESIMRLTRIKYTNCQLVGIPNLSDDGTNKFQRSFKKWLLDHNVEIVSQEQIQDRDDLLFLSLEYDRVIKPYDFTSERLFNIHFSLLPKYRGMYTSTLPILHGEKISGVTLHKIDNGIDTGDIVDQCSFPIDDDCNCRDLYYLYIQWGTFLVDKNLISLIENNIIAYAQDLGGASCYSKKAVNFSSINIDLNQCAANIRNQTRAYSFREYQLPNASNHAIVDCKITPNRSRGKAGHIYFADESGLYLATTDYNCVLYKDRFDELLIACKTGDFSLVQSICAAQRHIYEKDTNGKSALMIAA
ncbi:MAG: hypothetical protein LBN32_01210, partial [Helicobacteraceae bacterium]|nr:hypothetical protein [Helicobacteraceae bacterium]